MSLGLHGLVGGGKDTLKDYVYGTSLVKDAYIQETFVDGINDIVASADASAAMANIGAAMDAVAASQVAMDAVAASQLAMDAVVASQLAMDAVVASSVARGPFFNSVHLPYSIGDSLFGGFYAGIVNTGTRVLILAPDDLEPAGAYQYRTTNATDAARENDWDGLALTEAWGTTTTYPAMKYCYDLSYPDDGFSRWYLPAKNELDVFLGAANRAILGAKFKAQASYYWSATSDGANAWIQRPSDGNQTVTGQLNSRQVRPARCLEL